jgi:hypothetical protein
MRALELKMSPSSLPVMALLIVVGGMAEPAVTSRQSEEKKIQLRCTERATQQYGLKAVKIGGDIEPPEKLVDAQPEFPELPPATVVSGGIWIGEVLVGEDGLVVDAWADREFVIKPPFPEFTEAVLQAIKKWEYEPVVLNSEPTPFCMVVTVHVTLS